VTGPVDAVLAKELRELGTATIYEASKLPCYLPPRISAVWRGAEVVGTALPVALAAGDNLAMHRAVEAAQPGDVLVVDGQDEACGYWGDVLTTAAQVRGIAGLVIDGGVRDTVRLEQLAFPVFSSRVAIRGTTKNDPGVIGQPIRLGVASVRAGDIVVGDADGIVAIPADQLDRVVEASRARQSAETDYVRRIREGELTLDIYRLR
jgi:4-hydroxy-4-methyl-2-oxoglutarate aldolase